MFRLIKSANLRVSRLNLNSFKRCNSDVASAPSIPSPQTNPEILYTGVSYCLISWICRKILTETNMVPCYFSDIYQQRMAQIFVRENFPHL